MKKIIRGLLFFIIFSFMFLGRTNTCFAQTSIFDEERHDYEISNIDTTIDVSSGNVYSVKECITVNHYNNEEMCKVIPLVYDGIKRNVSNINVKNDDRKYVFFETKEKGNYLYINYRNEYSTPEETFIITYDYDMGYDYDNKKDLFYFDFIGTDVEDVKKLSFTVNLPETFDYSKIESSCDKDDKFHNACAISFYGKTIKGITREDYSDFNKLILQVSFDEGYFDVSKPFYATIINNFIYFIFAVLFLLICILVKDKLAIRYYLSNSSLIRLKNKLSLNNDIKSLNLSPIELSYIQNDAVSAKDVLCMLYYWQDKNYIEITRQNRDYKISFKEIFIKAPEYEVKLYNYFYDLSQNRMLYLSCISSDFNVFAKKVSQDMVKDLILNKKLYNIKYRNHGIIFKKIAQILFAFYFGILCYKIFGLYETFFEGLVISFAIINFTDHFLLELMNNSNKKVSSTKFIDAIIYIAAFALVFFLARHIPNFEIHNYDRFKNVKWEILCILAALIIIFRLSFNIIPLSKKGLEIKYQINCYKSLLTSLKREYTVSEMYCAIALDAEPILMDNKDLLNNEFTFYSSEKITINR